MRKAVSVIFEFEDKIFHVKRQNYLNVFPGYLSFPGGKVDKSDKFGAVEHPSFNSFEKELVMALKRECEEELGLDLFSLPVKDVKHLGIAITPEFNPYRFETHFFKVSLTEFVDIMALEDEAQSFGWDTAATLLNQFEENLCLAVPPTIKLLKALELYPNLNEELDLSLKYDPQTEVPMIESLCGVKQFLPLSNTFPPANRTNCFLIGNEGDSVLIDPSPKNDNEYEKLRNSIGKHNFQKILLTHHHPDHHERVNVLAKEFKVPVLMTQDTHERITKKLGNDYFFEVKVKFVKDGDVLCQSRGKNIKLLAVPGHDEGQVAPFIEDMRWMIVGDLIQSVGTVVIGAPEGDMAKYFTTLEKVISLNPLFILPSHGIAMGGVNQLEKTLAHRKEREKQIFALFDAGKSKEEILKIIYSEIDERLHKYAMKTIEAHLKTRLN